ncbi:MAG: 6-bladed beta-propeller [Gallionella sp.]|nr:6-bladed beta-propeller [Gallionella sp.]
MTTRSSLFVVLVAIAALSGCAASGPAQVAPKKESDQLVFPPKPEEPRYYFERQIRGNLDILPDTEEGGSLRRALTGEKRKSLGFVKPYAIAARHGKIYVGDAPRRSVLVFDIPGQKFFQIGLEEDDDGHGKISRPMGLDIDKAGNLYVLDATLHQVLVYTGDGTYLRSFGDATLLYKPAGIAVTPDGTRVYAVDIGGSSSDEHKIVVFDGITGKFLHNLGHRGIGPGEFNLPRDVTIAPDGSIYVVDGGNFRVQKFDKDEKYLSTFGAIGRQSGQFSRPKEIAVDPSGNVYVVDTAFGNFQIFNPEGQLLMAIGERSNANGPAKYSLPAGIAVDDDGRVYVVDQYFGKVDIFRPVATPEDGGWIGKFNKKAAESTESTKVTQPNAASQPAPATIDGPETEVK